MIPEQMGSMTRTPKADGIIFDLQRYSIHDGPGIRTLIFLKGCPLHCVWCSNPEGISPKPELMWVEVKCIHCGKCLQNCPRGALRVDENGKISIDRRRCVSCGTCAKNCYAEAIKMAGRYVTAQEVIDYVERDRHFFEGSGGGVTLGGGDPMMQPLFAEKLLQECKRRGLHTAMETEAHAHWESFEHVIPYVDLFLIDVKSIDSEAHFKHTGVHNERILENIRRLSNCGAEVQIRMPVIPGYNDSEENIRKTAEFAASLKNGKEIALLPYHELGLSKYEQLEREYSLKDVKAPDEERMNHLKELVHTIFNEKVEN